MSLLGDLADGAAATDPGAVLELAGWRREVHSLYGRVRADPDPRRAHALWRDERDRLFATHPQSPLPSGDPLRISGLPYWPYDPALRWRLPVAPVESVRRRRVDTGADGVLDLHQAGWVDLPAPVLARVAVWWVAGYGGGLFLPIRDASAGTTSYGGGRYLLDGVKGADLGGDGDLVIDLNFLYHPSCRYDPRWVCPLAAAENTLAARIDAGERLALAPAPGADAD